MNKKIQCKFCGEKKPVKEFKKDKRTKSGYSKYCLECEGKKPEKKKPVKKKERKIFKTEEKPICPHCHKQIRIFHFTEIK